MNLTEFAKGRVQIPFPLQADAYTIAGECLASPQAKKQSTYNLTNRRSPAEAWPDVAQDSRMVFFGLTHFIRNHLTQHITHEQIDQTIKFMQTAHSFGGQLNFDPKPWRRVVNEFQGYMPIQIVALPEGSTFFPNEPVIQVFSLDEGFGEMAAHIEAVMLGMVSIATARATLGRHWLEQIRNYVRRDVGHDKDIVDQTARFMIHDFGMRASSTSEESELLGLAHLLVFHGTDTFNAAYLARQLGAEPPTGTSILALAHRIVQGWDTEHCAFFNQYCASQKSNKVASYVADCYNFDKAVNRLAEMADKDRTTIVARPDSGDYVQNVLDILNSSDKIRYIQGDSMTPTKINNLMNHLLDEGFPATQRGIFGVGGYLRNTPNRDSLSSAYKLSAVSGLNPKVKLSEIEEKASIPGPNILTREHCSIYSPTTFMTYEADAQGKDAQVVYYDGNMVSKECFGDVCLEPFSDIQSRCINDFDKWESVAKRQPNLGLGKFNLFSTEVKRIRKETFNKYRN